MPETRCKPSSSLTALQHLLRPASHFFPASSSNVQQHPTLTTPTRRLPARVATTLKRPRPPRRSSLALQRPKVSWVTMSLIRHLATPTRASIQRRRPRRAIPLRRLRRQRSLERPQGYAETRGSGLAARYQCTGLEYSRRWNGVCKLRISRSG